MGTVVIPSHDTPLPLQFTECMSNKMPPLIERLIKRKYCISSSSGWYPDCHPLGSQRFPQPTRVITSVCQKRTDIGKEVLENGYTFVVADLPFSQQKQDGPPVAVISGMKFGIQSSFCATDETWRIPFLSRIAAVR